MDTAPHITEPKDITIARRARILVVDDDSAVRGVLVELLVSLGYDTIEARDGREALALINANERVDIVLTDDAMPGGISGVELSRRIAALGGAIKVLVISGNVRLHSGANTVAVLQKPITGAALDRAIRDALSKN